MKSSVNSARAKSRRTSKVESRKAGTPHLFGHDIIVIGASEGGVDALPRLIGSLPAKLPASVFVVLHTAPQGPGLLPEIIRRTASLPVAYGIDSLLADHADGLERALWCTARTFDERAALLRRLGERKYHSETVGKNWGAKAKELEEQGELIRKLLKTYQRD